MRQDRRHSAVGIGSLVLVAGLALTQVGCQPVTSQRLERFAPTVPIDGPTGSGTPVAGVGPHRSNVPVRKVNAPFAVVNGEVVPVPPIPMGDAASIDRILREGRFNNQVMTQAREMAERGPRLTASTRLENTERWIVDQLKSWGLEARMEPWGTAASRFDRGPSSGKALLRRVTTTKDDAGNEVQKEEFDTITDLQLSTLAWARGTSGPERGRVVRMPATQAEFEAVKDRLAGAWILIPPNAQGRTGIRGVAGNMRQRHTQWIQARERIATSGPTPFPGSETSAAPALEIDTAPGVLGKWTGKVKGPGLPDEGLDIALTITAGENNALVGAAEVPSVQAGNVDELAFNAEKNELTFTWNVVGARTSFVLKPEQGQITGTATNANGSYPITASRFKPAAPAANTADVAAKALIDHVLAANPAGFLSSAQDYRQDRVWTAAVDGWRDLPADKVAKDREITIRSRDYDLFNSALTDGADIWAEFNLEHTFVPGPITLYNVIGEIKGTEKPDEVVIVSGHLDSWDGPGSQGVVDNATGSAVTLEAARILAAAKVKPKRTIRFIWWTGEEQGLLGARAYVDAIKDQWPKISAMLNDDGGTDYQGGLPAADNMADYMAAATAPTNGLWFSKVDNAPLVANIRKTGESIQTHGGSDHAAFNAVGIPGFYWDEVGRADYQYGWHTQHDTIDLAIPEYLEQSATNSAITAFNLACAPELLPRGKVAPPQPRQRNRNRAN